MTELLRVLGLNVSLKVKVLVSQSCLTLCEPMDGSPPGSSVHGISQARILTGVGCHSFFQGGLPNPGSEPGSPALQADSLLSEPPGKSKCKLRV